ncbi:formin-binding protein 4 [Protopterus annectens]|uniref:formin-binding protein 4 n=1 Tax=Protopterus annectens TaxID=7888 RepID=UPI001CF9D321|nr:formin-binding protein 4 [Protopterus annectens]
MGKKNRAIPGRRPILRLSPPGKKKGATAWEEVDAGSGTGSEEEQELEAAAAADAPKSSEVTPNVRKPENALVKVQAAPVKSTGGLCLLGAYADSDEEEEEEEEESNKENSAAAVDGEKAEENVKEQDVQAAEETPVEDVAPVQSNHNSSADIADTLADFMAEIDAITAPSQPDDATNSTVAPTPPRPEPKETVGAVVQSTQNGTDSSSLPQVAQWQYDTQCSLAGVSVEMGDWQEVWDENTGCYYYWNTQTNEVTWELPQYLAHQLQGLAAYNQSTAVLADGAYVAQSALVSQEVNAAPVAKSGTAVQSMETKQKVNESVLSLSREDGDQKGVAASLLAPLLPDDVKKSEEKWRKKVICKEDAVEPEGESGEGGNADVADAGIENASPLRDRIRSLVQWNESSENEEEEEDTFELEMKLERKKAELRALEEGEGSVNGSSPRSDLSQTASQDDNIVAPAKKTKWKSSVHGASPESTSRSSDRTGRESPEIGEIGNAKLAVGQNGDDMDTEEIKEKAKQTVKLEEEDESDLKVTFSSATTSLRKKYVKKKNNCFYYVFVICIFAVFHTSKNDIPADCHINNNTLSNNSVVRDLGTQVDCSLNFNHLMFAVVRKAFYTRITDWREGALSGSYLKGRLNEAAEHLKQYEINATPRGWSCHWDREHRRYFYVNEKTGESQWEFPDVEEEEEEGKVSESKAETVPEEEVERLKEVTDSKVEQEVDIKPAGSEVTESCTDPVTASPTVTVANYWALLQPPLPLEIPPPPPPPPESPPPPPPPPPPPTEEAEIEEVEMEEESDEPPAPGTEDDVVLKPLAPPAASSKKVKAEGNLSAATSTTKAVKRKASEADPEQQLSSIGSSAVLYGQPSITPVQFLPGHQPAMSVAAAAAAYWALSVPLAPTTVAETTAVQANPQASKPSAKQAAKSSKAAAKQSKAADPATDSSADTPPDAPAAPPASSKGPSELPPASRPAADPQLTKAHHSDKNKKIKKEKLKKNKIKMPSLVQKWQSIQRELDEEKSSSSDEDRATLAKKRIEEWKYQQLVSGMAEKNANFEAIPADWRERLKKRKLTSST